MRNKILSTAIAAALSMGVHGVAQAQDPGTLALTTPALPTGVPFATELFPDTTAPLPTNGFVVTYYAKGTMDEDFYATFTLSSGTWAANLVSIALDAAPNTGTVNAALVENGESDQNTVTFLVPVGTAGVSLNTNDTLTFSFSVTDDQGFLASSGSQIRLEAAFPIAANPAIPSQTAPTPLTLATATEGTKAELTLDTAATDTFIDVAQDSKLFINSSIDELSARLGYVNIIANTNAFQLDGTTPYVFNGSGGSLEITDGVFSASDELGDNVFLDVGDDGIFTDGTDIPADIVTATTASWDLDVTELGLMLGQAVPIVVKVNGTTEIEAQEDPVLAVLTLDYPSDSKVFQRRLEHIKRNGTRCKAYNVPYPGLKDNAFFRFTSKTDGVEGVVKGTLYKEDGTKVASDKGPDGTTFTDVDLLGGETLTVNQTKVISNQAIADLASEVWTGRATLVISSNLTSMEMLALLRNQQGVVGPLMNLSTGASGNACD
jgi:hypothetical protein